MRGFDLEELRRILRDTRDWINIGTITKKEVSKDRSVMRVQVKLWPSEDEIVARMTWDAVGPDSGFYAPPQIGDVVLLGYDEGDGDTPFIISRMSSKEDTIPKRAAEGDDWVLQALGGKKLNLGSDTRVNLGRGGDSEESEPLVLGNILVSAMGALYDDIIEVLDKLIAGPVGMGNLGNPTPTYPQLITDLTAKKAKITADKSTFIDTAETNILSDIAFTEK